MALSDALGAVDPQSVVNDLMRERATTLAQNSSIDPQSVLNRLIRKHMDQRQQRKQEQQTPPSTDFASFGKTKDEVDATPPEDFAQYGQTADEAEEAKPKQPEKKDERDGILTAAGKGLSRGWSELKQTAKIL